MVLSDENSWINYYVPDLLADWAELGHDVRWGHEISDATGGDFCFCLGFVQFVPRRIRRKFHHTLVVHESDLPRGKGWSPLTWQILEGRNRIPVTLIEAADDIDGGVLYAQRWIDFHGHELVEELRATQASMTKDLCQWFVTEFPSSAAQAKPQTGHDSQYCRRGPDESRLDPNRSISEQFNLLRVVDNDKYPAFFEWMGHRYRLAISKNQAQL